MIELSGFFSFIFLSVLVASAILCALGFLASRYAEKKQSAWLNKALRDQADERVVTKEELAAAGLEETR